MYRIPGFEHGNFFALGPVWSRNPAATIADIDLQDMSHDNLLVPNRCRIAPNVNQCTISRIKLPPHADSIRPWPPFGVLGNLLLFAANKKGNWLGFIAGGATTNIGRSLASLSVAAAAAFALDRAPSIRSFPLSFSRDPDLHAPLSMPPRWQGHCA